ncbi:hypothetical protein K438DRAFT_1937227 [Mycena galopus ATCC 62051]|nr:hypothetical protein K438DRAFT_1937227 [Mycena galopus ATCC 62051]
MALYLLSTVGLKHRPVAVKVDAAILEEVQRAFEGQKSRMLASPVQMTMKGRRLASGVYRPPQKAQAQGRRKGFQVSRPAVWAHSSQLGKAERSLEDLRDPVGCYKDIAEQGNGKKNQQDSIRAQLLFFEIKFARVECQGIARREKTGSKTTRRYESHTSSAADARFCATDTGSARLSIDPSQRSRAVSSAVTIPNGEQPGRVGADAYESQEQERQVTIGRNIPNAFPACFSPNSHDLLIPHFLDFAFKVGFEIPGLLWPTRRLGLVRPFAPFARLLKADSRKCGNPDFSVSPSLLPRERTGGKRVAAHRRILLVSE